MVIRIRLQGRDQDRSDIVNIVALGLFYRFRIAAVFADARDCPLVRTVSLQDPVAFRSDVDDIVLITLGVQAVVGTVDVVGISNAVCRHTAVMVGLGIDHRAVFPDSRVAEFDDCLTGIIFRFPAEAKQAGTGGSICVHARNTIIPCDVQDIVIVAHIAVIDVQHRFQTFPGIGDRAILKVDGNILFPGAEICIDVNNFSRCLEFAVIKGHRGRRIRPNRIVFRRTDKDSIFERCGRVAPVEGLTLDHAVLNNCVISACKAKVIDAT